MTARHVSFQIRSAMRATSLSKLVFTMFFCVIATASLAQELTLGVTTGPETGLPMPRFVSIKASEAYVRRGPSFNHRIDWVYNLRDLPVAITAEHGHWRRVQDVDGQGGWIHYTLLSGARSVIITAPEVTLLHRPENNARQAAVLRQDVVARVRQCTHSWCQLRVDGSTGWVPRSGFWGVGPSELIE